MITNYICDIGLSYSKKPIHNETPEFIEPYKLLIIIDYGFKQDLQFDMHKNNIVYLKVFDGDEFSWLNLIENVNKYYLNLLTFEDCL